MSFVFLIPLAARNPTPTHTAREMRRSVLLLGLLYMAQGLPFGFQAKTLPLLLRVRGASLEQLGLAGLLNLPWMLKLAWAPLVDSYYASSLGKRRSYILPCQLVLGKPEAEPKRAGASVINSP